MSQKAEIIFKLSGEDGGAQRVFRAVEDSQQKVHDRTKKTNAVFGEQADKLGRVKRGADDAEGGMVKLAKSAMEIGAAVFGVQKLIGALEALDQKLKAMADRSDEGARGLADFSALQKPGAEGRAFVQNVATLGAAEFGMRPDETGRIAQPFQTMTDKDGSGLIDTMDERRAFFGAFGTAGRLMSQGVEADDARRIITTGDSRGLGAGQTGDLVMKAADVSAVGAKEIAKTLPEMTEYSDLQTGLAFASAMSYEQTNEGELPTLVARAGKALGKGEEGSKFQKRFKLGGLTEMEKIARLREIAAEEGQGATEDERVRDFTSRLGEYGMDETLERKGVGILIRQSGRVSDFREQLDNSEGTLAGKYAAIEDDPIRRAERNTRRHKALVDVDALYGGRADLARQRRAEEQGAAASALASEGTNDDLFVGEDGGLNLGGRMMMGATRGVAAAQGKYGRDEVDRAGRAEGSFGKLADVLSTNNSLLAENNKLMAAENNKGQGGAGLGGKRESPPGLPVNRNGLD